MYVCLSVDLMQYGVAKDDRCTTHVMTINFRNAIQLPRIYRDLWLLFAAAYRFPLYIFSFFWCKTNEFLSDYCYSYFWYIRINCALFCCWIIAWFERVIVLDMEIHVPLYTKILYLREFFILSKHRFFECKINKRTFLPILRYLSCKNVPKMVINIREHGLRPAWDYSKLFRSVFRTLVKYLANEMEGDFFW